MKLKLPSSNEIVLAVYSVLIVLALTFWLNPGAALATLGVLFLVILYLLVVYGISRIFLKLPAQSLMIYPRIIEVHIGGLGKNARDFVRKAYKSINYGVTRDYKVVIYTWHYEIEDIQRNFGESVVCRYVSGFEKISQLIFNKHKKEGSYRKPLLRVDINPKDLSDEVKAMIVKRGR
ncbi:hypothetical protein [Paenibacillus taichungensis]